MFGTLENNGKWLKFTGFAIWVARLFWRRHGLAVGLYHLQLDSRLLDFIIECPREFESYVA
jgi:hypothetical protein